MLSLDQLRNSVGLDDSSIDAADKNDDSYALNDLPTIR